MSHPLDLTHLRSLVAIAETGGFGRAATTLHVSQSTISQHVRLLEKRLGKPLVERQGRSTRFTPAGERLLVEARRILAVHDDALDRFDALLSTTVIIGSTETAAEQVLPTLLAGLRAALPERQVQFHIDRSTQMIDGVTRGTLDLAVILGFPGDIPGRQVGTLELGWYSAAGASPQLGAKYATGEHVPLVAYVEPCGMRQRAMARLGDAGATVELAAESTSIEGVLAAARAGLGVAVLPRGGGGPLGLELREDLPELGQIGVFLAARKGVDPDIEARAFDALSEFFALQA